MNSTFVNQVMSKNLLTLDKSASLQDAAENMKKLSIGCVIVTENNNPIGIITERDFVTKSLSVIIPIGLLLSVTITHPTFSFFMCSAASCNDVDLSKVSIFLLITSFTNVLFTPCHIIPII